MKCMTIFVIVLVNIQDQLCGQKLRKKERKKKKSSQNRTKAGLTVKFSFSTCTYQHLFHCSAGNSVSEINVCNLTCTCCSLHSKRTLQVHSIPHKTQCLTCQEQSQLQTSRHFLHKDSTKSLKSKTIATKNSAKNSCASHFS